MVRPDLEFDDVIYHLQTNRGASLYWRELGREVARLRPEWWTTRRAAASWARLLPVPTTAKVFHSSLFRVGITAGRSGPANVVTIHDLTYELGLISGPRARVGLAQRRAAVRHADGLVFISGATKAEFDRLYPSAAGLPSVVAWHGRDLTWDSDVAPTDQLPDRLEPGSYLLHIGHRDRYKNFELALDGYAMSNAASAGRPFVVLGPPLEAAERASIARRGLTGQVRWYESPTRSSLRMFMYHAFAVAYVSKQEGFGLPLIESMQCGVPVLAANASCLPEIAGDAAMLVDPVDPASFADALDDLEHPGQREALVRRGFERVTHFSWEASARAHIALYEALGAGG